MDSKLMLNNLNTFYKSSESWKETPALRPKDKVSSSLLNSPMNLNKICKEDEEFVNIFCDSDDETNTQSVKNLCSVNDNCDQLQRRGSRIRSFVHNNGKPKEEVKQDKPINFEGSFTIFDFLSRNNKEVVLKEEQEYDLNYLSKNL